MKLDMTPAERETFLCEARLAIVSISETDRGPFTVPDGSCVSQAEKSVTGPDCPPHLAAFGLLQPDLLHNVLTRGRQ
jgi:hypothetical protein